MAEKDAQVKQAQSITPDHENDDDESVVLITSRKQAWKQALARIERDFAASPSKHTHNHRNAAVLSKAWIIDELETEKQERAGDNPIPHISKLSNFRYCVSREGNKIWQLIIARLGFSKRKKGGVIHQS